MKTLLLDLDGTMYHGNKALPSAVDFIKYLQKNNILFYFLTNNSSRTPLENAQHMLDIGYQNIQAKQFFNSAMACVSYVKKKTGKRKVFIVGQTGLKDELILRGFNIVEEDADIVMVGLNKAGDYYLYSKALRNLLNGAVLVGTNSDRVLMDSEGISLGNGSIVSMLEYASGQTAIITGKPSIIFIEEALNHWGLKKEEVILIGDNLETDIQCGINGDIKTVLVLTGVHQEEDIYNLKIKPDMVVSDLNELITSHKFTQL